MPRRNKPKRSQQSHVATIFDSNFNHKCYSCAFAGKDFVCDLVILNCTKTSFPTKIKRSTKGEQKNVKIQPKLHRLNYSQ